MYFLLPIIVVCFLIFLYNLYFISHEDFVIIRQDISMEKIFSLAFLTGFFSFFFSRLFYIVLNPDPKFFNPLGFIAFTYYPGLSIIGLILGAVFFINVYSKAQKMPAGKLLDLFTASFLGVFPIGFLFFFLASFGKTSTLFNILFILSFFMSLVFIKPIFKLSEKGEIKDGSYTLIFLSVFSFIYFIVKLFIDISTFSFFDLENVILFITIFGSLILLINQEIMDKVLEKK